MTGVSTVSSLLLAAIFVARISAVQHPSMPPGMTHEDHLAQMQKDAEMKKRRCDGFRSEHHHTPFSVDGQRRIHSGRGERFGGRRQPRAYSNTPKDDRRGVRRGEFR